jgi:HSP20 family protein
MESPGFRGGFASSPWELMRRMSEDLDTLFESFGPRRFQGSESSGALWAPDIEVERKGKELRIRADLPGLKPEDIEVDLDDGVLTISGERKHEQREEREGVFRTERSYGRFVRSLQVPDGLDESDISATFRNGVLEITVPIQERQQKRIQVKS